MSKDIYKSDYDFNLPHELIAQHPLKGRTDSLLMHVDGNDFNIKKFTSISTEVSKNDCLIVNETKVIKSRLLLTKQTGGDVEIFILQIKSKYIGQCLTRGLNKNKKNQKLYAQQFPIEIQILRDLGTEVLLKFNQPLQKLLESIGHVPLPPYLKRHDNHNDKTRYQTIFANNDKENSVAAPTASLHFDEKLFSKICSLSNVFKIDLSIGLGTFKPLPNGPIQSNAELHDELFYISEDVARELSKAKKSGKRMIAIGTTVLRALESAWDNNNSALSHGPQSTKLFIKDGYKFQFVDSLITNFHLPQSSLLMLVSAFGGKGNIREAYNFAIKNKMRFFSYGDAMYIKKCLSK